MIPVHTVLPSATHVLGVSREIKNRQTYDREIAGAYKAETDTRVFYE